jgi:hypothetical protein
MDAHDRLGTADLLTLLDVPTDGRLLTFGAPSVSHALAIATARPDALVVACDTSAETISQVSERALAERLDNIVAGDTPAGPLVDRALCVDGLAAAEPQHLIMLRTAMLPGGYAIFVESAAPDAMPLTEKLLALGYGIADALDGALAGSTVIRAR